ncbi:MAG: RidA family protein [Candidatus Methylopumilus sp.]|jgi:enamine deaminase RidA (YjgF/YER057c/UK114 family)
MEIKRINPSPRWSDMTIFNGIAHFVEVPADASTGMQDQVSQVLAQAEATLLGGGSDKSRLLSVTIYITDFNNLGILNSAWEAWLPAGCAPSRACLKAELVDPSFLVEIAFVAALNQVGKT